VAPFAQLAEPLRRIVERGVDVSGVRETDGWAIAGTPERVTPYTKVGPSHK